MNPVEDVLFQMRVAIARRVLGMPNFVFKIGPGPMHPDLERAVVAEMTAAICVLRSAR